jgi:hypothetical protein
MPRGSQPNPALRRLVLFFAAVATLLWLIAFLPLLHGHSTPLFPGGANFEDVLVYQGRFTVFHTTKFFTSKRFSGFAYPAGSAVIYAALYSFHDAVRAYLLLAAVSTLAAIATTFALLKRVSATNLLLPLLLLSFPWIFLLQRANIELVLWMLVALGLLAYTRGWPYAAAILFGLAAACKLYPIFLVGLFLRRKQDLPIFLTGIVTFLLAMGASIAFAGPAFLTAAQGFFTGVDHFQDHYAQTVRSAEINWDHCLFSPVKYWSLGAHASLAPLMRPYYLAAGTLALLLFLRIRTMPFLNRALFLITAMVALPPVSYDYTLVHLYLPALLLLCAFMSTKTPATVFLALTLCFFLFLPLCGLGSIYPLPAGPIQAFFVLALLITPALQPWPATLAREAATSNTRI